MAHQVLVHPPLVARTAIGPEIYRLVGWLLIEMAANQLG